LLYDVIVLGGGVIGASSAYHLKRTFPNMKILLIEQYNRVGAGNTAKSAALFRNIFSSSISRLLTNSSIKYYLKIGTQINLRKPGYLWLFSQGQWQKISTVLDSIDETEFLYDRMDTSRISKIVHVNLKSKDQFHDVSNAIFGHLCGSISATVVARHYHEEFQKLGGNCYFNTKIIKVNLSGEENCFPPWDDIRIKTLTDANGTNYVAKKFLFATGAWTHGLLVPLGISPGVLPKKRQLFAIRMKNKERIFPSSHQPVIILPTGGVYIKPIIEKNTIVVGCGDKLGRSFHMEESYPPEAKEEYFHCVIEPVIKHYFPDIGDYNLFTKWAGYYSYSPDNNPIIDQRSNAIWVSGTSGSGIMKADALGRITASKVLEQEISILYDGREFKVSDLSLNDRKIERERLII
jgi:FAD-dependent oxidoreductase domain-containing protein 1